MVMDKEKAATVNKWLHTQVRDNGILYLEYNRSAHWSEDMIDLAIRQVTSICLRFRIPS